MKILLISSNISESPYPVYPLGLSIVADSLIKEHHIVEVFDFLQQKKSLKKLLKTVNEFKPELIGISIRNIDNVNYLDEQSYIKTVVDIVKALRQSYFGKIILGGSGFSLMPEKILGITGADYGIVGEGENAILHFIKNMEKGKFPVNKLIRQHSCSSSNIGKAYYKDELVKYYCIQSNMIPLQTKRGCPNKCVYCTYPLLEGCNIRCRPIKEVINDIKILTEKYGVKTIFFTDSVFNDADGNYIKLLKEIKKEKIDFNWTCFIQPGNLTEENVRLMRETGLTAAEIGSDAASDITLKKLGKNFSFNDISKTCELLRKYNISTFLYYMFGGPGESCRTVKEGIENIKTIRNAVSFIYMGIRILPNTMLEKIAINDGILKMNSNLLGSVYYIAPELDKIWIEETLCNGFKNVRNCIFPPNAHENILKVIHKLGYTQLMQNKLICANRQENK